MGEAASDSTKRTPSFSRELFDAVRNDHTTLNKLITSRLPLGLPPHADNPLLYLQGIIAFGLIYDVFENQLTKEASNHGSKERGSEALGLLCIPGLLRRDKLQQDVHELQHRLGKEHVKQCDDMQKQAMRILHELPNRLAEKPHLIYAYTWAMYLAMFNGGRWIRGQLRDAGEVFWMGPPPLSFWEFEDGHDGTEIHLQFKDNFEIAARQLTDDQWAEVVQEAPEVFALCLGLVGALEGVSQEEANHKPPSKGDSLLNLTSTLWTAFGYIGVLFLLRLAWPRLLDAYTSWTNNVAQVVQVNGTVTE